MRLCVVSAVFVWGWATICHGFLEDGGSCAGNCYRAYNPSYSCQCNSQCQNHGNCCNDFGSLCLGHSSARVTCSSSFPDVTEALWSNDVNRLDSSMYTLNFQTKVSESNNEDQSTAPFFTRVDHHAFSSRPTFQAFLALQDNYDPTGGSYDPVSGQDSKEINAFLDAALRTSVMNTLLVYLKCRNIVSDEAGLRAELKRLWFTPYSRHSGGPADSSGFEHVMVGEFKSSAVVNGLHNWLAYYDKEGSHQINYYGYVDKASLVVNGQTSQQPNLVAINYEWRGRHKALGSFVVGSSPEFDMALFTLCALTHNGNGRLSGRSVHIQTWDIDHVSGNQIGSAYVSF